MIEIEAWKDLDHDFILPFLGVLEMGADVYLVSPYLKHGSVTAYTSENPDAPKHHFVRSA